MGGGCGGCGGIRQGWAVEDADENPKRYTLLCQDRELHNYIIYIILCFTLILDVYISSYFHRQRQRTA